ncbi:hypothetical protein D3C81_1514270 [compost metagenome]
MSLISGISRLGSTLLATEEDVPLSPVSKYSTNIVPPEAKAFIAIPPSIICVLNFSVKKASTPAISTPPKAAPSNPSQALPVYALNSTPTNAEVNMIPSRPIFTIPARLEMSAPRAANRIGVVTRRTENANSVVKMTAKKLCILLRLLQQHSVLPKFKELFCGNQ